MGNNLDKWNVKRDREESLTKWVKTQLAEGQDFCVAPLLFLMCTVYNSWGLSLVFDNPIFKSTLEFSKRHTVLLDRFAYFFWGGVFLENQEVPENSRHISTQLLINTVA